MLVFQRLALVYHVIKESASVTFVLQNEGKMFRKGMLPQFKCIINKPIQEQLWLLVVDQAFREAAPQPFLQILLHRYIQCSLHLLHHECQAFLQEEYLFVNR